MKLINQFIEEISFMKFRLDFLERENKELLEYRDKYFKLLKESTNFSREMSANLLVAALNGNLNYKGSEHGSSEPGP